jgi:AraC-like DNA-binding protein
MEKHTVSMHFVAAAVARLSEPQKQHVLAAAGIPQTLLASLQARVPAQSFAALWLAVAREIDDEFFGLDQRRMKVGSFALLCHAVLGNPNLDRALKHILRSFALFLDDIDGELSLQDQEAVISLNSRIKEPQARRFAEETLLVMVHGLMCWLAGKRIPLLSASFAFPRPPHAAEYTAMYSEQLGFDAEITSIHFDAKLLSIPVVQRLETLKVFLRTAPQSVFVKYRNEGGMSARVRRRLRSSIGAPEWPVLEDVASEFHMSPTTLRRRLEAESMSYQGVKDEVRRDAAIHYLCNTSLSVVDIGSLLGFQEPSAFRRAFKKWSTVQPGEYRRRNAAARKVSTDAA